MSLKDFHLLFITLSVLTGGWFAYWGFSNENFIAAVGSAVLSAALIVYEFYFFRKMSV